jgi:nitric oxide reductase large subunit
MYKPYMTREYLQVFTIYYHPSTMDYDKIPNHKKKHSIIPYLFFVVLTYIKFPKYTTGWWFEPLRKIRKSVGIMKFPMNGQMKLMFQTTRPLK